MTLWLVARATGFIVLIAATLSVVLGSAASAPGRPERRLVAVLVHRTSALTMLAALIVHVVALVLDVFVNISLSGALIPFTAGWQPLAVGLGTLAMWGFVVVIVGGLARGRLAGHSQISARWRALHMMAWPVWALSVAHGFLAGTDTGEWWAMGLYGAAACAGAVAGLTRILQRHGSASYFRVEGVLTRSGSR